MSIIEIGKELFDMLESIFRGLFDAEHCHRAHKTLLFHRIKTLLALAFDNTQRNNRFPFLSLQHMSLDKFGHTTIRNIYFDTDTYRLVCRSLEKPIYKEKLRIRSYIEY